MISLFYVERHGLYSDFVNFFSHLVQTTNSVQETKGENIKVWIAHAISIRRKKINLMFDWGFGHGSLGFFEQWITI